MSLRADLPTLDYEADDITPDSLESSSSRSQELRDFEVYNRTTLPLLVEASLRPIIGSQVAPIGEMVIDVVRTCQSTVARNFDLMIAPTSSADDRTQPHSPTVTLTEIGIHTREESARLSMNDTADESLDLYHEPPHLNAEASATNLGPVSSVTGTQVSSSDSGYSSIPNSCACFCHGYSNTGNTANGKKLSTCAPNFQLMIYSGPSSCESCTFMHFDFDDLIDLDPGDP